MAANATRTDGLIWRPAASEPGEALENDFWHETYLYSRAASVYGGTQQIQRNIIADRILALPQE